MNIQIVSELSGGTDAKVEMNFIIRTIKPSSNFQELKEKFAQTLLYQWKIEFFESSIACYQKDINGNVYERPTLIVIQ